MATKTAAKSFTSKAVKVEGVERQAFVVLDPEGAPILVTFSQAKAEKRAAYRTLLLTNPDATIADVG